MIVPTVHHQHRIALRWAIDTDNIDIEIPTSNDKESLSPIIWFAAITWLLLLFSLICCVYYFRSCLYTIITALYNNCRNTRRRSEVSRRVVYHPVSECVPNTTSNSMMTGHDSIVEVQELMDNLVTFVYVLQYYIAIQMCEAGATDLSHHVEE